ncbi:MAG TPA: DUF952 domain-containing protein [Terriglobia bacterium]
MKNLYHVTTEIEAREAKIRGDYAPKAFEAEGFIHCAYTHQLAGVLDRFFKGQTNLVMFEIDRSKVPCKVIDENLGGGAELFPHIYGRLPMRAVKRTIPASGTVL